MKIITNTAVVNGTSLKGYIHTTYQELVDKLGEPRVDFCGDGKVTCEWIVEDSEGNIGTIYDWKTGSTPKGSYDWHIGGHTQNIIKSFTKYFSDSLVYSAY
jgi:hypothetical protein